MSSGTSYKALILQNKPEKAVVLDSTPNATFALKTLTIPDSIPDDTLLVKAIWVSNDPAQRGWIQKGADPRRLYVPPVKEGEIMRARAVSKVLKVGGASDVKFQVGSLVVAASGWSEYAIVPKQICNPITPLPGLSPSVYLGAFGISGLTAYWGVVDVLKLQAGETLVVTGAAGAVGNIVVQYAKNIVGAKVIAIAGTEEKLKHITALGADVVLNYKSASFTQDFKDATEDFVEAYFDNVGGPILDLVLTRMKSHGRIAACGAISGYNDKSKAAIYSWMEVITNKLSIKGFIVAEYIGRPGGVESLVAAYKQGKLKLEGGETIVDVNSIEELPKVWLRLFEGANQGKLVTKLPE